MHTRIDRLAPAGLALLLGACAPTVSAPTPATGLPPIPRAEGPLDIQVVHPTPTTPLPGVDSTFVYGSVGTGRASLSINGTSVPVAPNGAFLAYLPVPEDGVYQLTARAGGRSAAATRSYRMPAPAPAPSPGAPAGPVTEEFPAPRAGVVTGGADTLATGSEVAIARPTPGGTYRWFLPRGARLRVTGRQGQMLRVRLDASTEAWIPAESVALQDSAAAGPGGGAGDAPAPVMDAASLAILAPEPGWTELRFDADGAPFLVAAETDRLEITLYGRTVPPGGGPASPDPLIAGVEWSEPAPGSARATVRLSGPAWGYKAFYTDTGDLAVRIRRPPAVDAADPLRGRRIAVDPGHPPGGATGPTGLTEAEANLAIALRLAEQLRARGAEVLLTRSDASPVSLGDRVDQAVAWDAELLVSVHNNAFAEGTDPFRNHGTSTYYFHPFSAPLAEALDREIAGVTRIPDLGAKRGNLALVRPTWMPTTLTESLFMLIPEQEAALRDPGFLDRLATAHVRGIEAFLRSSVIGRQSSVD